MKMTNSVTNFIKNSALNSTKKRLFAAGSVLTLLVAALVIFYPSPSVTTRTVTAEELQQYLGEDFRLEDGIDRDQFATYLSEKRRDEVSNSVGSERLASSTKEAIEGNEYNESFSQSYVTAEDGGVLETDQVKVIFPVGAVDEDVIITYRTNTTSKLDGVDSQLDRPYSLTAHSIFGEEITQFNKDITIEVKLADSDSNNAKTYYFDEVAHGWVQVRTERNNDTIVAYSDHFTLFITTTGLPTDYEPADEYEYGECGTFIDDTFDVQKPDETDRTVCFASKGPWELSAAGVEKTALYSDDYLSQAWWTPDYEGLDFTTEVFAIVPEIPELRITPENPEPQELATEAMYYILHADGIEEVTVDLTGQDSTLVNLGEYDFDGSEAEVYLWGLTDAEAYPDEGEPRVIVADAICFGDEESCKGQVGDITPPVIEDVKAEIILGEFHIQAKVTDETAMGDVYALVDGQLYLMTKQGDTYSTKTPLPNGGNLAYQIIAYDAAGNESIWDPTRGYISRSSLAANLGVPPWAFYMGKGDFSYIPSAKPGSNFCNQFCGDPINTQNGNLLETVNVIELGGRPEIDLDLTYNSMGNGLTIFGESWNHSYNYHLVEFDNADFQGAVVTYPGGRKVTFIGSDFTPEPGNFETLEKQGDTFVLTFKDLREVRFDIDGDVTRIQDANGNGLNFTYGDKLPFVNLSQITEIKADGGRSITFEYTGEGLVSKINAPEGKTIEFEYNDVDDLIAITDGRDNTTGYEYDENHAMTRKVTPEGHDAFVNTFDENRRVTSQLAGESFFQEYEYLDGETVVTDGNGHTARYIYNEDGLMSQLIDEEGNIMQYEYNADKKVSKMTTPDGHATTYAYDDSGNKTLETDPQSHNIETEYEDTFNKPTHQAYKQADHTTDWEYDSKGNLIKITNALGDSQNFTYDSKGQLIKVTDFKGNETIFTYNNAGDLTKAIDAEGNTTRYKYDDLGRKVVEINPRGHKFTFGYDGKDNLTTVNGPLGYTLKFEYDKNGHITKEIDSNGGEITYAYDTSENLVKVTDQLGHETVMEYGEMNENTSVTDPEGRITKFIYTPTYQIKRITNAAGTPSEAITTFKYNGIRRVTSIKDPEGRIAATEYDELYRPLTQVADSKALAAADKFTYSPTGAVTKMTDAEGNTLQFELDALDRITQKTDAEGNVTRYEYDKNSNLVKSIDPKNSETIYEYDKLNRLIKTINAENGTQEFKYDANNNLVEMINENGIATRTDYDELDRPVKVVDNYVGGLASLTVGDDANITTTYEYDLHGNLTKITNPRGFTTQFEYDAAHRQTKVIDAENNTTSFTYDKVGNLTAIADRNGNTTANKYDELNRVVSIVNAENHKVKFAYDKVGNLIKATDARGNSTAFTYNGLNQQVQQVDALGGVTKYDLDLVGNLTKITDANGHSDTYAYDNIYRLTSMTNAEGHSKSYSYDAASNLISQVDANGNATNYAYDKLHRLTQLTDALGGKTSYAYDPVGNILSENDANGHIDNFEYDPLNRVKIARDAENNSTKYNYDNNSNIVKVVDGNGNPTVMSYDTLDRLIHTTNAESEKTAYGYDNETNVISETANDGVITAYNYDKIYRLVQVNLNAVNGGEETSNTNVDTNYSYDPNGNLIKITDPKGNITAFKYDELSRQIKEINALGNSWSYGYDAVGNRTSRRDANGNSTIYAYYPDDQLKSVAYHNGTALAYQYDANNNRTQLRDSLGTTTSTYDALNRLTSENDSLDREKGYKYDAVGNTTEIVYPDGRTLKYGYLKNDWLHTATDPESLVTKYERDSVGNVVMQLNPNNTIATTQYDKVYRPTSIVNQQLGGKTNSSFAYEYDSVGQRTQVTQTYAWRQPSAVTENYSYDALRRLTGSNTSEGITNAYTYDRNSNRLTWVSNDDERTPKPFDEFDLEYGYDAINALQWVREKGTNPKVKGVQNKPVQVTEDKVITTPSQTKTITKKTTIPKVVSGFVNTMREFRNQLEAQKGKNVSDTAYNDLMGQVEEFVQKAEDGLLIQSEAQQMLDDLRQSIQDYSISGEIKAKGTANSLLTKLKNVESAIATLPEQLDVETATETVTIPGTTTTIPGTTQQPGNVLGAQPEIPQITFKYDNNGNRIEKEIHGPQGPKDQLTKYTYDPEDRIASITNFQRSNGNKWTTRDISSMQYDGDGRRLVKEFDPKKGNSGVDRTEYVYDGLDIIANYSN